jgi:hypothetical protein
MSIGNLKTDGNKGNNFPWQLRMLKGLQDLYDTNFETAIVVVECPGPIYTAYLEVRTWDQISTGCGEIENKLSEPTYYLPGDDLPVSGTIVGPGCVMRYTDDSTILYDSLLCCQANGVILNDIRSELGSLSKVPIIERISGTTLTITVVVRSISIACPNTSGGPIDVSTDGGINVVQLFPGEIINFDAGTLNNYFAANLFKIDCTLSPGDALITYII